MNIKIEHLILNIMIKIILKPKLLEIIKNIKNNNLVINRINSTKIELLI